MLNPVLMEHGRRNRSVFLTIFAFRLLQRNTSTKNQAQQFILQAHQNVYWKIKVKLLITLPEPQVHCPDLSLTPHPHPILNTFSGNPYSALHLVRDRSGHHTCGSGKVINSFTLCCQYTFSCACNINCWACLFVERISRKAKLIGNKIMFLHSCSHHHWVLHVLEMFHTQCSKLIY